MNYNALEEINADSFAQKAFTSSRNLMTNENNPIVVDLTAPTVNLSEGSDKPESIFHPNVSNS